MAKKIKVILKNNDYKINKTENIMHVTRGYALNYLIPKNIAEIATPGKLKHLKMIETKKKQQLKINKEKANEILTNIEKINKINIKKKHGNKQQIFGKVNEKEILNKIFLYTGYTLDKKQINIPEIKQIGIYKTTIALFNKIETSLLINILPEIITTNI
nr:ribosomal protein L9 [Calliblepharis sp.]